MKHGLWVVIFILVYSLMMVGSSLAQSEKISVTPQDFTAGTYQNIEFRFTAGSAGIEQGGGVRIELPTAYLETEPYFWDRPQTNPRWRRPSRIPSDWLMRPASRTIPKRIPRLRAARTRTRGKMKTKP